MALLGLMGLVPGLAVWWPGYPWLFGDLSWSPWALLFGGVFATGGVALGVAAGLTLGKNLDPLPRPKAESQLVMVGPYAVIRHPIYSALLLMTAGWAIVWGSALLVGLVVSLAVVFLFKSRLEERWLTTRYADYEDYRSRTGALLPRWPSVPLNPPS